MKRPSKAPKKSYAEQVSEELISQLEKGTAPFQKPWNAGELTLPYNATTDAEYKGSNSLWLTMQGRSDPRWMTYKQAQSVDAQVKKGEKGTTIQYWKFSDDTTRKDSDGKPVKNKAGEVVKDKVLLSRPRVFSASVFNAEQIEGLPERVVPEKQEQMWKTNSRAEAMLLASGASITNDQPDRAFYRPSTDKIHLPEKAQFDSPEKYYQTALHELGHWTGHKSRLDRDLTGKFGSESYAKEELRAEISSMMVSAQLGTGHDIGQHAAYVKSWIKALKDDPTEILRASKDADKIREFVMSYDRELSPEQEAKSNDAVLQKAEKYAQTLTSDSDKAKFMENVRSRLDQPVQTSKSERTLQTPKQPQLELEP